LLASGAIDGRLHELAADASSAERLWHLCVNESETGAFEVVDELRRGTVLLEHKPIVRRIVTEAR
jgi:hypothetical protein